MDERNFIGSSPFDSVKESGSTMTGHLLAVSGATGSQVPRAEAVEPLNSHLLKDDVTAELTKGYTTSIETLTSDTITPDLTKPFLKTRSIVGNVTINIPSANGACNIVLSNSSGDTKTVTVGTGLKIIGTVPDLLDGTDYIVGIARVSPTLGFIQFQEGV